MTFPFPYMAPKPGLAPLTPYRYYRVLINAIYTVASAQVQTLEFLKEDGSVAPLTGSGAVSSTYPYNDPNGWMTLFDGDDNTAWISKDFVPQWMQYDFGSGNQVAVAAIRMVAPPGGFANRMATNFNLLGSNNGTDWTNLLYVRETLNWTGLESRTFYRMRGPSDPKRIWRVNMTANNGDVSSVSVKEVVFKSGGLPCELKGSAFGSSYWTPGSSARYAFDGNTANEWLNGAAIPQYVAYDFGRGYDVDSVTITGATSPSRSPRDFSFDYSNDEGATWVTSWSVSGVTWTASETKTFNKP